MTRIGFKVPFKAPTGFMKDENIDIEEGQKKGLWHTIEGESSKRKT
jgi:hypothetical protein